MTISELQLHQWQLDDDITLDISNETNESARATPKRYVVHHEEQIEDTPNNQPYKHLLKKRPQTIVNRYPENDKFKYEKQHSSKHTKTVPGNSSYSSITNKGKKVLLLTDSLCGGIKGEEINPYLKNAHLYRTIHPGAKAEDIEHYCTRTLKIDKPDMVIINCGTNNIKTQYPYEIYKSIKRIVESCHSSGVNDVFVSSIPIRRGDGNQVDEVNNYLRARAILDDYIYINNSNIIMGDLGRDGIHLRPSGTDKLFYNFVRAINGIRRA